MATKQQIAELWQTVFHDSDEFINLFFSRVYKPENTLSIEHGGKVISALQMVPYEMKIVDKTVPMAYVCGVCTLPSEQGKGYMKKLMQQAMDTMQQRGFALTTLIPAEPWLFDFYKKFGYTHLIHNGTEIHQANETISEPAHYTIEPCTGKEAFDYFNRKQRERKCAVLHNAFDFETVRLDCIADEGNCWLAREKNLPVGIAFESLNSDNHLIIKEILSNQISVKNTLIQFLLKHHNTQTARVRVSATSSNNAQTYASACIFDKTITKLPEACLSLMLD